MKYKIMPILEIINKLMNKKIIKIKIKMKIITIMRKKIIIKII